ncbi:MAG: hypothetical protein IJ733_19235 [Lachnospiraceae bacterium]|nr:hypothetical protein [Lachnospiraceae bacterium]
MPRKKKKPGYNPEVSMDELVTAIAKVYGSFDDRKEDRHYPSLNALAAEFDLNVLKVRKLLITAAAYSTAASRKIASLSKKGLSEREICEETGLSKASVNSYLPYENTAYKLPETSVEADRAKAYRIRNTAVKTLCRHITAYWDKEQKHIQTEKEMLWRCVLAFEGYRFKTAKNLPFTYSVKENKTGDKGGELLFSRKAKGVTRATVEFAYDRVVDERSSQNDFLPIINTPKKLNVFGASYLYAMFIRFELVRPE